MENELLRITFIDVIWCDRSITGERLFIENILRLLVMQRTVKQKQAFLKENGTTMREFILQQIIRFNDIMEVILNVWDVTPYIMMDIF
jgi:hypothetical protein